MAVLLLMFAVAACGGGEATLTEEAPSRRGNAEVFGEVQDIVAEVMGLELADVTEELDFKADLGATDGQMEAIIEIFEEAFSVTFTGEEVSQLTTIQSAVDLIVSKR